MALICTFVNLHVKYRFDAYCTFSTTSYFQNIIYLDSWDYILNKSKNSYNLAFGCIYCYVINFGPIGGKLSLRAWTPRSIATRRDQNLSPRGKSRAKYAGTSCQLTITATPGPSTPKNCLSGNWWPWINQPKVYRRRGKRSELSMHYHNRIWLTSREIHFFSNLWAVTEEFTNFYPLYHAVSILQSALMLKIFYQTTYPISLWWGLPV